MSLPETLPGLLGAVAHRRLDFAGTLRLPGSDGSSGTATRRRSIVDLDRSSIARVAAQAFQ